jgi:hypothetical protein
MNELLFGPWAPLFAYTKQHPWQVLANVLALAQLGILITHMIFGEKGSSGSGGGGDIGGWDFGDGDGGECGD